MKTPRPYQMTARADAVATTKERIVEAATALFLEHAYEDVTLAGIASAAEVSHQTVLNHFESKAGVVAGVAEVMDEQIDAARYGDVEPGDVAGALHALVGDYERMGDANARWAMEDLDELRAVLDYARAGHQRWLATMFGADLPPKGAARRRAVNALHAATDVYVWKLLRRDLRLSRAETEKTMIALVEGVLRGENP